MRTEIYTLPGAEEVTITWPHQIDAEEWDDLKQWLDLVAAKMGRNAHSCAASQRSQGEA